MTTLSNMTITDSDRAAPASAPPDLYALYRPGDTHPAGHATGLSGAVAALAALLERPLEDLHTEQPGAYGDWLVRDAAGVVVGAIALEPARTPIAPASREAVSPARAIIRTRGAVVHMDGIDSGATPSSAS